MIMRLNKENKEYLEKFVTSIPQEEKRLNYLHNLNILDTDFDENFDRITKLLQKLLDIPIVLISLVDINRQWFKSCIGLNVRETSRELSFCSNAIKDNNKSLYIINDTLKNDLYKNHDLVTGNPNIRCYIGYPISINDYNIGTICAIDNQPRNINIYDKEILTICGELVESEINKLNYIKKLKDNETSLKNISSIINHDLINIISPIVSLSECIIYERENEEAENEKKDEAEKEEFEEGENVNKAKNEFILVEKSDIEIINECARNAIVLSNDLIDHSKLDLNTLQLNKESINIYDFMQKFKKYEQISINIECDKSTNIYIDKYRINQVLHNLILNSIDFIDKKNGEIKINISKKEQDNVDVMLFSISDNGIGIKKEKHDLVFKKFCENFNPDIKRSKPRTGLGLYICKKIVNLHDGDIKLEESDIGCNFCFYLPFCDI